MSLIKDLLHKSTIFICQIDIIHRYHQFTIAKTILQDSFNQLYALFTENRIRRDYPTITTLHCFPLICQHC